MTRNKLGLLAATVASVGLIALSGAASAQGTARPVPRAAAPAASAAAAAPQAALPQGPAIPGVCVFSEEAAVGLSAVGKFTAQRIQQLASQANAELGAEKTGIETDAATLQADKTIADDVRQQRTLALNQRAQALQRKAEVRNRELELTNQKAIARISTEINPLLRQAYITHNCSVLLNGQAIIEASPSMDVTQEVVRQLDAKITQFPFDREHLDQPQPGQPAGR